MADVRQFKKLAIRGFRGLCTLDLDELGSINVLLGANDVGKTSILEAIFLVSNLSEPALSVRVQNRRNFMVQKIDDLSSVFFELDFDRSIEIEAFRDGLEYRKLSITAPEIERSAGQKNEHGIDGPNGQRLGRQRSRGSDDQSSSVVHGSRVLQYDAVVRLAAEDSPSSFSVRLLDHGDEWGVDSDDSKRVRSDSTIPARFLGPTFGYDTDRIGKVVIGKKDDQLLEFLRIINERVTKVSILGDIAYLDIGLSEMMPLNMFGSGMVRAAMILSECLLREVRILLIDELEYGLHYQAVTPLLEALLKLAEALDIQVFATTHSIDVLKGLQEVLRKDEFLDYRDMATCFTIQRDKEGVVRPYRYAYEQFDHCVQHSIEIR
ncbi:MAG: ATP-binding protein [Spirochaetaceae bacterium]|nr:ATP-binding protein [Spirochaetaceae bacterium]